MGRSVREIMTSDPITVAPESPVTEAARAMRDADVGAVVVVGGDGSVDGIVTDRDITIRAVAEGRGSEARVADVYTPEPTTLSPDHSVDDAVRVMREKAIRRVPVVEGGKPVGILSLGDLAVEQDPGSALADISAAEPDE